MSNTEIASNSGIRKLSNGERVIPSSVRADGTVRKEIRVKPGYRPPEDVELYKNRTAESWKNRGKGGIPGAESVDEVNKATSTSNKNAKRREARKKANATSADDDTEQNKTGTSHGRTEVGDTAVPEAEQAVDPEVEKAKEARKLAKKLRQARELKGKKEQGDSLLPEQFAKVIKIQELIRQLDRLGFDADGEKKATPE